MALYGNKMNPKRFHKSQLKFYAYLIPMALFMALPIVFIISHAFKPMDELFAFPPRFLVSKPTLDNLRNLFISAQSSTIPISRYAFNSVIVTVIVVFLSVLLSSMAGYALSKMRFKGKRMLFEINNMALMFVPVAVIIPRYLTVNFLGIDNTYLAHIIPIIAMPIGLFLIKQYIDQIPDSLIEAAFIDGAGDFAIYRSIIVPVIMPALTTAAILAFQAVWNNLEGSALFVTDESLRTLNFYMNTLAAGTNVSAGQVAALGSVPVAGQGMAAAAGMIMFFPNLILFIVLQSNVMNTMAHSGLK